MIKPIPIQSFETNGTEDKLKDLHNWFDRDIQFNILAYLSSRPIAFNLDKIKEYVYNKCGLSKDNKQNNTRVDYNIFYLVDSGLVENVTLIFGYKITAKGIDLLINDNGSYLRIKN